MTVRELINKLMDMNLDDPVYITKIVDHTSSKCVGFVNDNPIELATEKIIDVDIHGVFGTLLNCITVVEEEEKSE